jgi:hypothetical protein
MSAPVLLIHSRPIGLTLSGSSTLSPSYWTPPNGGGDLKEAAMKRFVIIAVIPVIAVATLTAPTTARAGSAVAGIVDIVVGAAVSAVAPRVGAAVSAVAPRFYNQPAYYNQSTDPGVNYCIRRFRSYDPYSRTYLGYDGYRHPCP